MLKLITTLLSFVILDISWVLDCFLGDVLGLPSLVYVVVGKVGDIASPADGTHLFADSEGALGVGRGVSFGLDFLCKGLRGLLSRF